MSLPSSIMLFLRPELFGLGLPASGIGLALLAQMLGTLRSLQVGGVGAALGHHLRQQLGVFQHRAGTQLFIIMYHPPPTFLTKLTSQSRTFPIVPMSSVTGRPRGYAWCGGSLWGSPRGQGRRCGARFRLLSYIKTPCCMLLYAYYLSNLRFYAARVIFSAGHWEYLRFNFAGIARSFAHRVLFFSIKSSILCNS